MKKKFMLGKNKRAKNKCKTYFSECDTLLAAAGFCVRHKKAISWHFLPSRQIDRKHSANHTLN